MSAFAKRLKSVLAEKRILQKELADYMGISFRTINSYAQGNSEPSFDKLIQICKFLNVSADYLIGTSDEFRTLDNSKDEFADDMLTIRRSYTAMDTHQRELVKSLVESLIKH